MRIYEGYNIVKYYGTHKALSVPHIRVEDTSVLALVGANGAGKSTLLRLLAFLEKPSQGELHFYGDAHTPQRQQVTLLLQEPYLLKTTVFENVAYGLRLRHESASFHDRVCNALAMVGFIPEKIMHRQWNALSGGERQRVSLAARLVLSPKVLLLDEPTSNLDTQSTRCMQTAVNHAVANGTCVVIASHDLQWLQSLQATILHIGEE